MIQFIYNTKIKRCSRPNYRFKAWPAEKTVKQGKKAVKNTLTPGPYYDVRVLHEAKK
jgi:hypothetical protein